MVTTTSPLSKLSQGFGAVDQNVMFGQRTAPSNYGIQRAFADKVSKQFDPTLSPYINHVLKTQVISKPDVSGIANKHYIDTVLKDYGRREISDAGMNTEFGKYVVPTSTGSAQTLTHLGDKNTNWLLPMANRYVGTLSPTLAELLPKTASAVTIFPIKNTQTAAKPTLGAVISEIEKQSSAGKGYDIGALGN